MGFFSQVVLLDTLQVALCSAGIQLPHISGGRERELKLTQHVLLPVLLLIDVLNLNDMFASSRHLVREHLGLFGWTWLQPHSLKSVLDSLACSSFLFSFPLSLFDYFYGFSVFFLHPFLPPAKVLTSTWSAALIVRLEVPLWAVLCLSVCVTCVNNFYMIFNFFLVSKLPPAVVLLEWSQLL